MAAALPSLSKTAPRCPWCSSAGYGVIIIPGDGGITRPKGFPVSGSTGTAATPDTVPVVRHPTPTMTSTAGNLGPKGKHRRRDSHRRRGSRCRRASRSMVRTLIIHPNRRALSQPPLHPRRPRPRVPQRHRRRLHRHSPSALMCARLVKGADRPSARRHRLQPAGDDVRLRVRTGQVAQQSGGFLPLFGAGDNAR